MYAYIGYRIMDLLLKGLNEASNKSQNFDTEFGGKGNAAEIIEVVDEIILEEKWSGFFEGFKFPY